MNDSKMRARVRGVPLYVAVFSALTLSVGCRGCGSTSGESALVELAGTDTQIAFTTGDLVQAASATKAFLDTATKKGGAMATNVATAAQRQLGFNPFEPEGYAEVGIDPKAGMIFFSEGANPALVLGLKAADEKKLDEWIASTLKRLDGASEKKTETEEGVELTTVGRPFGTELIPVSHWTFVNGVALIAQAPARASLVNAAKRLSVRSEDAKTLADDPLYQRLTGKLPKGSTFELFLRGTAAQTLTGNAPSELSKGAVLGMTFSEKGFGGDFFVDFPVPGLGKALSGKAPAELAAQIGEDALVAMVTRSAKADALESLRKEPTLATLIDGALGAFEREAGMKAEAELLPLLAGPLTGALYLIDAQKAMRVLQRGARNPNALLEVLHASVTAEVTDRAKMLALLDQAVTKLESPNLKFKKTEEERGGRPLTRFEPDRPSPRLGWALYGDTYVYGAGTGRLDAMLDVLDGKKPAMALEGPGKALGQKKGASVFVIRVGEIGERVGAMTGELSAAGPMLGQVVTSVVETAKTFGDVAIALEADTDGLRLSVREELGR